MKRKCRSVMAIALSVAVMFTFIPLMGGTAMAASKSKAIKITAASDIVDVGGTIKLKASQKVKWKSSNKKVATVSSNGVVKGKKAGDVKITAVSKKKSSVKKSIKVFVCPVDKDQLATLRSARLVNDTDTLYEVNYIADYKPDIILGKDFQKKIQQTGIIADSLLSVLIPNSKYALKDVTNGLGGCSSFTYKLENGHYILGRNYDWSIGDPIGEVIHTDPEDGYASVGMADLSFAKLAKTASMFDMDQDGTAETKMTSYSSEKGKELTLLAPYYTVDGVNEKGLSCGVLICDENSTLQGSTDSDNILVQSHVIRSFLDKCATVDEAINLMKSKDIQVPIAYYDENGGGSDFHWAVTDATGDACIIEYVDSKMYITKKDGVYNANGKKIKDGVLKVDGKFNVEGFNDFYYGETAYTPESYRAFPAVAANDEGKTTSRANQNFVAVTNFFISAFEDKDGKIAEGATTFVGEGVSRYQILHNDLTAGKVKNAEDAMDLLEDARYGYNDPDLYATNDFLYKAFKEGGKYNELYKKAVSYYESIGDKETAEYYQNMIDAYPYVYDGDPDNPYAWGWETYWSSVYDVTDKKLNVVYHQDYNNVNSFTIDY